MFRSFPSRPALCALSVTLTSALMLSGCPAPLEPGIVEPASSSTPAAMKCEANKAWITNPTMPSEVASTESFCDFYQFSWQWFLAQVSPLNPSDPSSERVFESNRVLDPNVSSGQCAMKALTGRGNAIRLLAARGVKPHDFEEEQADGSVLYDQNGNILYYSLWYSEAECQSITVSPNTPPQNTMFAPGTMELKVAWKILPKPDSSYFTMQAKLPGGSQPVTLGLVGFHLVNWTSKHPEMIWASFEHKTNAPLCDGSSPMPANGWSFASGPAAQCLTNNPQPGSGPPNAACAAFNFNTAPSIAGAPPATGTPAQICRQFAHGNQPGTSVNGNDNAANLLAIQQLNEQLVGPTGLLTVLPATDPMSVWQNYGMVGGLWTKDGAPSGNPPVASANGPADASSPQRGSLELANMTMETFEQGDTSSVPNCFGCHNFVTATPLTVSHISKKLFSKQAVGGVAAPTAANAGTAFSSPAAKQ